MFGCPDNGNVCCRFSTYFAQLCKEASFIERINATDLVVNYVKTAIQNGDLKVGDKLPREADIAEELSVGRSSLREGFKILNAYGVIEARQGEGTFVVDNRARNFFEFLGYAPSKENMEFFLELRRVIEVGNVALIYDKISDAVLEELERGTEVLKKDAPVEQYVIADQEFHSRLIGLTNNPMLIQVNNMITSMRTELLYNLFTHKEIVEEAYICHNRIIAALKTHNLNTCLREVAYHVDKTILNIRDIYSPQ